MSGWDSKGGGLRLSVTLIVFIKTPTVGTCQCPDTLGREGLARWSRGRSHSRSISVPRLEKSQMGHFQKADQTPEEQGQGSRSSGRNEVPGLEVGNILKPVGARQRRLLRLIKVIHSQAPSPSPQESFCFNVFIFLKNEIGNNLGVFLPNLHF